MSAKRGHHQHGDEEQAACPTMPPRAFPERQRSRTGDQRNRSHADMQKSQDGIRRHVCALFRRQVVTGFTVGNHRRAAKADAMGDDRPRVNDVLQGRVAPP